MKPTVKIGNFNDIPDKVGLKDGGHVILSCSACGEPLVDVWITKADAVNPQTRQPFKWKVKAKCCYCGDASFVQEVVGRIAVGPAGKDVENPDPQGMNDSLMKHSIVRIELVGDTIIYHTKKKN